MSADEHDHDGHHGHGHDHPHPHDHEHAELPEVGPTPVHGYWKSLRELAGNATLQTDREGKEFPPGAGKDRPVDPLSRRNFFQLMGASMALAGVGGVGCRRYEKEEIVPLARRPEDMTPGLTTQYATSFELGGVATPLLATSFEGRPIHLEGNTEHPWHSGAIVPGTDRHAGISTFAQASILHLYDPDRQKTVMLDKKGNTIEAFRNAIDVLRKNLTGVRVLCEATSSPTVAALKRQLQGVGWHEYEAISWDNERLGTKLAFGRAVRPIAKLEKCATIVTIDCDIFTEHPASLRYSRDFAKSRRMDGSLGIGQMNRLWSVESQFSNAGAMADHRLSLRSDYQLHFVKALDEAIAGNAPGKNFLSLARIAPYVTVLAAELKANHGKAVVLAGRRASPEVHAVVAHLNAQIGAFGNTLDYFEEPEPERASHVASIQQLVADIKGQKVQSLIIIGGNPVYDAPADLDFGTVLASLSSSVHLSEYYNETSDKAHWFVPRAHYLETWGDARSFDGTITLSQPLIAPLWGGVSTVEMLSMLAGNEQSGEKLVRSTLEGMNIISNWRQHVADGFVPKTPLALATVNAPNLPPLGNLVVPNDDVPRNGEIEVTFAVSPFTYDGRYANNAWLHETPDFLTKVTWDNYVLVGPETATACGVENDHMVTIKANGREITLPCYTIPGQARGSVSVVLGGGRTLAGRVGGDADHKSVGWETNKLRTVAGFESTGKATLTGGEGYELASIQEHWDIRTGLIKKVTSEGIAQRLPELIKETTAKDFVANKVWHAEKEEEFFNDLEHAGNTDRNEEGGFSLFKEKDYEGHRWAMAIDLSTCTGCNACTVACQSENNIPVVGRKEVMNNREMSWIRIDRYFSGSPDDPKVVHQPIGCQQCEQAPCEQVCPVGATSHSDEGLNDMAYNRCIGTRYCANNCPYKVRRFNFLDWNSEFRDARNKVRRLLFNPDVTVRMRGVMEKCSFCVQRILGAKIKNKAEHRSNWPPGAPAGLTDNAITTACQAACPTEAIVFGDLSDKDSRVSKLHADRRSYALLPETYTKPRNRFLARIRNPNKDMAPKTTTPAAATGGHE